MCCGNLFCHHQAGFYTES